MKRGDLVQVRWGSWHEFDEICIVLDVQHGVRGGSWIYRCSDAETGAAWNQISHVDKGDLLLVCDAAKGSLSWIDCSNVRLVSPS